MANIDDKIFWSDDFWRKPQFEQDQLISAYLQQQLDSGALPQISSFLMDHVQGKLGNTNDPKDVIWKKLLDSMKRIVTTKPQFSKYNFNDILSGKNPQNLQESKSLDLIKRMKMGDISIPREDKEQNLYPTDETIKDYFKNNRAELEKQGYGLPRREQNGIVGGDYSTPINSLLQQAANVSSGESSATQAGKELAGGAAGYVGENVLSGLMPFASGLASNIPYVGGPLSAILENPAVQDYLAKKGGNVINQQTQGMIERAIPSSMARNKVAESEEAARDDFNRNILPNMLEGLQPGSSAWINAKTNAIKDFENNLSAKRAGFQQQERQLSLNELLNQQEEASRQRTYGLSQQELALRAQKQDYTMKRQADIDKLNIPEDMKTILKKAFLEQFVTKAGEAAGNAVVPYLGTAAKTGYDALKEGIKKGFSNTNQRSYSNNSRYSGALPLQNLFPTNV